MSTIGSSNKDLSISESSSLIPANSIILDSNSNGKKNNTFLNKLIQNLNGIRKKINDEAKMYNIRNQLKKWKINNDIISNADPESLIITYDLLRARPNSIKSNVILINKIKDLHLFNQSHEGYTKLFENSFSKTSPVLEKENSAFVRDICKVIPTANAFKDTIKEFNEKNTNFFVSYEIYIKRDKNTGCPSFFLNDNKVIISGELINKGGFKECREGFNLFSLDKKEVILKFNQMNDLQIKNMTFRELEMVKLINKLGVPYIMRNYSGLFIGKDFVVATVEKKIPVTDFLEKPTSPIDWLRSIAQIGSFLNILHKENIVHADIKLENLLYDEVCKTIEVIDLGFCQHLGNKTSLPPIGASAYYSSYEVTYLNMVNKLSDCYSFGVVIMRAVINMLKLDTKYLLLQVRPSEYTKQQHTDGILYNILEDLSSAEISEKETILILGLIIICFDLVQIREVISLSQSTLQLLSNRRKKINQTIQKLLPDLHKDEIWKILQGKNKEKTIILESTEVTNEKNSKSLSLSYDELQNEIDIFESKKSDKDELDDSFYKKPKIKKKLSAEILLSKLNYSTHSSTLKKKTLSFKKTEDLLKTDQDNSIKRIARSVEKSVTKKTELNSRTRSLEKESSNSSKISVEELQLKEESRKKETKKNIVGDTEIQQIEIDFIEEKLIKRTNKVKTRIDSEEACRRILSLIKYVHPELENEIIWTKNESSLSDENIDDEEHRLINEFMYFSPHENNDSTSNSCGSFEFNYEDTLHEQKDDDYTSN